MSGSSAALAIARIFRVHLRATSRSGPRACGVSLKCIKMSQNHKTSLDALVKLGRPLLLPGDGAMGMLLKVALLAVIAAAQLHGQAQAADPFPTRPVRIVVGFSPGTTSDVFARMIAQKLAEKWGQSVLVENRDGAAGSIG